MRPRSFPRLVVTSAGRLARSEVQVAPPSLLLQMSPMFQCAVSVPQLIAPALASGGLVPVVWPAIVGQAYTPLTNQAP